MGKKERLLLIDIFYHGRGGGYGIMDINPLVPSNFYFEFLIKVQTEVDYGNRLGNQGAKINPLVPGDLFFEFDDESSNRGALW